MKKLLLVCLLCLIPFLSYASGPQVLATGSATLANTKLSLAANYAFMDFGVDLTAFVGEQIEICAATAPKYCIRGIISTVGTGETLSATERVTNGTFDSGAGWTPGSGWAIGSGVATGTSASTVLNPGNISSSTGALFLSSLDINSVSSGSVRFYWEGEFSAWYSTTGTKYWYLVGRGYDYTYYIWGSAFTGEIDNISTKQVTAPSSTGHWIKSAPGATDGVAWSYKHASFNPNDSAGYTYRILSTNIPGKQIASGTVSATDVKLATVDGGAMVEITGVDLSPFAGDDAGGPVTIINPKSTSAATMTSNKYLLCLYDSSSRVACGYVGAAGGGETLGAEIATGTLTAGKLYKITATEANHFYTGCAIGEYFTSVGTETCDASNKVQEVTEVEATGLHGHSTPNATDRKMSLKTTGFDPNAVTSYKIYRTY